MYTNMAQNGHTRLILCGAEDTVFNYPACDRGSVLCQHKSHVIHLNTAIISDESSPE